MGKRSYVLVAALLCAAACGVVFSAGSRTRPDRPPGRETAVAPPDASRTFAAQTAMPLRFEPNHGQTDGRVRYISRGAGYTLFLTTAETVLALHAGRRTATVRVRLEGANPASRPAPAGPAAGTSNYLTGRSSEHWTAGVPQYERIRYAGIYPGIDLVYYGKGGRLEYDLVVEPSARPDKIRFNIDGARRLRQASGDLLIETSGGAVRLHKPAVYQEARGFREPVEGRYKLLAGNQVGFEIGAYDRSRPLVIDPVLNYASYLGGSGDDSAKAVATDKSGNIYVAGVTSSIDFPASAGAYQGSVGGNRDIFLTKLDPSGTKVLYSTYIGGIGDESPAAIAVDPAGSAYLAGTTTSADFPTMRARFAAPGGGQDAFVLRLQPDGAALAYSTYLGGSGDDEARGLAIDPAGYAYIAGKTNSPDFPLAYPLQSRCGLATNGECSTDAFVTRISPDGSTLAYSTYVGGSGDDGANGIAVDGDGYAYIAGQTSGDFPTVHAAQPECGGHGGWCSDGFVSKLATDGSALLYSTYLGGSGADYATAIAADAKGNAYVTGRAGSGDFPVARVADSACRSAGVNCQTAFVTALTTEGAIALSRFVGGSGADVAAAVATDGSGAIYIAGQTTSADFPATSAVQPKCALDASGQCSVDAFVTALSAEKGDVLFSTFLGGRGSDQASALALTASGEVVVAGRTDSADFPTASALQPQIQGPASAFVATISSPVTPVHTNAGIGGAAAVCSGTNTFIGSNSTAWETASNWSAGHIPTASDTVCIPAGVGVVINSAAVAASVTADDSLSVNGGSLTLGATASSLNARFTLSGNLNVPSGGTVTIAGTAPAFAWSAGTVQGVSGLGAGSVSAAGIDFTGSGKNLNAVQLANTGAGLIGSSGGYVYFYNGAILTNTATGVIDIDDDNGFYSNDGTAVAIDNKGTINRKFSTNAAHISVPLTNTGSVNVYTGSLNIDNSATNTGTMTTQAAGAALNFTSGTFNQNAGGAMSGPGGIGFAGATAKLNAGTYNVTGSTGTSSGNVTFFNSSALTITAVGALNVSGGTTTFNNATTIKPTSISVSGGTLGGSDPFLTTGVFNWTGGSITGIATAPPAITAPTLHINGGGKTLDGRRLIVNGTGATADMTDAGSYLSMQNGATIENLAGATFSANNDNRIYVGGTPTPQFNNAGTFNRSAVTQGSFEVDVPFNNSGTVNVTQGTLNLAGGGSSAGSFSVGATTSINFDGTHTLSGVLNVSGAATWSGGNTSLSGSLFAASATMNAGNITVTGPVEGITSLTVNGGTTAFATGATITPATVTLSGGNLGGSDTIAVTGTFAWNGGRLYGSVTPVPFTCGSFVWGGSGLTLDTRKLTFTGTGSNTNGNSSSYMSINNGGIFQIASGATLNLSSSATLRFYSNNGSTVQNDGTFNLNTTSNMEIDGAFNNGGTVNVPAGILYLYGGGASTGAYNVGNAELHFANGHSLSGPLTSTTAGAGTVAFDAGANTFLSSSPSAAYNISGATTMSGGSTNFAPGSVMTAVGTVTVGGGTLSFNSGAPVSMTALNLSGGVLGGADTLNIAGMFNWTGGTFGGASGNTLQIANANGGMTLSANGKTLDHRLLVNNGVGQMTAQYLSFSNGAQITNSAGKTFTVTDAYRFFNNSGGLFQNDGTFVLNSSSQDMTSDVAFNNTGTVNVQSRVLALYGGGASTGTFNVASELDLANGHTITGTVTGAGTVAFNGGGVTIGGASGARAYSVTGATVCNSGTASFIGGTTVTSVGVLTVNGGTLNFATGNPISAPSGALNAGTLTGSDPITFAGAWGWNGGTLSGVSGAQTNSLTTVNGALSLGGGGKTLDRRTLTGAGGTTVTGSGYVYSYNNAVVQNPAGQIFSTGQDYNFYNGSGGTFQNDGTLNVSSPNHFSIDIVFNNGGTANAKTGLFQITRGGASSGAFNVTTVLELDGTHALTGTIAGAGTVHFTGSGGGTTNVGGASGTRVYNITGATQVDSGTINFAPGETMTSVGGVGVAGGRLSFNSGAVVKPATLSVTGGTLDGSDTITVAGLTHWTGGNIAGGSGATQAVLNANGGLDLSGGGRFLYSRTLNNAGAATMNSSYMYMDGTAILNNLATGTFDLQAGMIYVSAGSPVFNNAGTLTRSTTTSELIINPTFVNTGAVNVKLGTLDLGNDSAGSSSTGTMAVSGASSALKLYRMQVGGTVSGPGTVSFAGGASTVSGAYNVTGGTSVPSGSVLFASGATPTSLGPLSISGGTCTFSTGVVVTAPSLSLTSGTLTGADTINVSGGFTWAAGTLSGVGAVNASGAAALGGGGKTLDTRQLNLAGPSALTDNGYLYISNGGLLHVTPTGTLNLQNNNGIYNGGGTGSNLVQNEGTLIRNAATGTATIDTDFVNLGTVTVQTGVLHFSGAYTQTAGATNLAGGSLAIASNHLFDIKGGLLAGTGTVTGSVSNAGTLNPGAATGTMAITGAYTQTATGVLVIGLGGASTGQYDTVSVGGAAQLNGTLNITLLNSYVPVGGESFPIVSAASVSGTFASILGSAVGNGVFLGVGYSSTGVALNAAASNPTPAITYLAPASLPAGAVSFALQVNGYNFVNGSTVMWNGSARSTTYVSSTTLIAQIAASDVASPATIPVTVYNPPPPTGGLTSAAANFSVLAINGNITIASNNVAAGNSARIPVTLNLASGVSADSISFGVTVTPNAGAPAITTNLTFVNNPANSTYPVPRIDQPQPNQIAVSWLDPLSPVLSASVYLGDVVVSVPSTATPTQTYTAQVTGASASLGTTTQLTLGLGTPATLTVTGTYLVGDVYPFSGNIVGQFGNDTLENLDLVNALRAIANFAPYTAPSCSDRYDAMDANGDGSVDNLDLLVTLGRLSFPDQVRPRRGSRGLYCPASVIVAALRDDTMHVMKRIGPGGTAGVVVARMELGAPATAGGSVRVPVYLDANQNINLLALTVGVRLPASSSATQIRFVTGDVGGPTLLDTDLSRRLAASWLHGGIQAAAGQRLLIGYISLPGGSPADVPKLRFSAVQGHDAATGQGVLINFPVAPPAGEQQ